MTWPGVVLVHPRTVTVHLSLFADRRQMVREKGTRQRQTGAGECVKRECMCEWSQFGWEVWYNVISGFPASVWPQWQICLLSNNINLPLISFLSDLLNNPPRVYSHPASARPGFCQSGLALSPGLKTGPPAPSACLELLFPSGSSFTGPQLSSRLQRSTWQCGHTAQIRRA